MSSVRFHERLLSGHTPILVGNQDFKLLCSGVRRECLGFCFDTKNIPSILSGEVPILKKGEKKMCLLFEIPEKCNKFVCKIQGSQYFGIYPVAATSDHF